MLSKRETEAKVGEILTLARELSVLDLVRVIRQINLIIEDKGKGETHEIIHG